MQSYRFCNLSRSTFYLEKYQKTVRVGDCISRSIDVAVGHVRIRYELMTTGMYVSCVGIMHERYKQIDNA